MHGIFYDNYPPYLVLPLFRNPPPISLCNPPSIVTPSLIPHEISKTDDITPSLQLTDHIVCASFYQRYLHSIVTCYLLSNWFRHFHQLLY